MHKKYPTDISNRQWETIRGFLPKDAKRGRPCETNMRDVVNAIVYRWNTGIAWRLLPNGFPPWGTVYWHFAKWKRSGVLRKLREEILGE